MEIVIVHKIMVWNGSCDMSRGIMMHIVVELWFE